MSKNIKYILNIIKNEKILKTYRGITEHMIRVFNLEKMRISGSKQINLKFDKKLAKKRIYIFSEPTVEDIIELFGAYFDKKIYKFSCYFIFSKALYYLQSPVPAEYLFKFAYPKGEKYRDSGLEDTLDKISELPKLKSRYIAVECIIKSLVLQRNRELDKVIEKINVYPKVSKDIYPLFYWCQIMKEHEWCQYYENEINHPHLLIRHYREIYDSDKHSAAYFLYFLGKKEHTVLMQNEDFFTNATYYNIDFYILKMADSSLLGKYLAQIDKSNLPIIIKDTLEYDKLRSYLKICPLLDKQRIITRYELKSNKNMIKIIDNILNMCPAQEIESDFLNSSNFREYILKRRILPVNIFLNYSNIINELQIRINLEKLVLDKFFFEKLTKIDKYNGYIIEKEGLILFVKFGVKNEITKNFSGYIYECVKIDQYFDYNYFEINIKDIDPTKITKICVKDNYIILEPYGCVQILPNTCYSMCVQKKGITLAYFTDGDTEIICAITTFEIGIFNTPGMFEYIIDFRSVLYTIIMNCSEFEIKAD